MANHLSGKTALVTGGAKRLGRAVALALADSGADVAIHHRSSIREAQELASELRAKGVRAWTVSADLGKHHQVESLIDRVWDEAGRLDILINNASIFSSSDLESVSFEDLTANIQVNAWVPFELARRFARRAARGHIVNFLDTRVVGYDWSHVAYIASKHVLALFTRMMAVRFAPGIAVNAVAPGLILPPEGKDQSYLETLAGSLPLQRTGDPRQVADAVLYLVTSEFVTGQVIYVDGGRHVRGFEG